MAKTLKRTPVKVSQREVVGSRKNGSKTVEDDRQHITERKEIRSRYRAVKNLICEKREDISRVDSNKFQRILTELESLHQQVQKPREQVADAEAILDITNTLVVYVKSLNNEGVTPADFVTTLLQYFGHQRAGVSMESVRSSMVWGDIGIEVADVFRKVPGCSTMLGPMNTELKQRKTMNHRKRKIPTGIVIPKELDNTAEERADTDKNVVTMFDILKKERNVKLENLLLNRNSFAQTVENVFALSFLVKDGRVQITVDNSNCHIVSPRNAPAADSVVSGDVSYSHFVFRFDFRDWKMMKAMVREGEELMPHRNHENLANESKPGNSQVTPLTTSVETYYRNWDLCVHQPLAMEESTGKGDGTAKTSPMQHVKRKLGWV